MTKRSLTSLLRLALVVAVATAVVTPAVGVTVPPDTAATHPTIHTARICNAAPRPGFATCLAIALARPDGTPLASKQPKKDGLTPADVQSAYHLTGLKSHGRTVAVVDAYGYSHLEADLAEYRTAFGLEPCTTKNGCLTIVDQHGGTNYPPDNKSWDIEQALDVDAVSATCPDCKILVVQAKSAKLHDLAAAVDTAAKFDVSAISNSYIGGDRRDQSEFDHPGIAITAGTGDRGYEGGDYPATDTHVVAVGGTSIVKDQQSKRGWKETAWRGSGSGCSEYNKQPKWQNTRRPHAVAERWPTSPRPRTREREGCRSTSRGGSW